MSKKAGKLLALAAVVGAAAGAFYYYKSKENSPFNFDDFDDLDDFEDEDITSDELEEYLNQEAKNAKEADDYVPLKFSRETMTEAKRTIKKAAAGLEEVVCDAVSRLNSAINSDTEPVSNVVKPEDDTTVEEFKFDDLNPNEDDFEEIDSADEDADK